MKYFFIFFAGIIVGIGLTIGFAFIAGSRNIEKNHPGLTLLEQREEKMQATSYKIIQVLEENYALANEISDKRLEMYLGQTVLIKGEPGSNFCDEQIIEQRPGKNFYKIGTFKYDAKSGIEKTVPVISLLED